MTCRSTSSFSETWWTHYRIHDDERDTIHVHFHICKRQLDTRTHNAKCTTAYTRSVHTQTTFVMTPRLRNNDRVDKRINNRFLKRCKHIFCFSALLCGMSPSETTHASISFLLVSSARYVATTLATFPPCFFFAAAHPLSRRDCKKTGTFPANFGIAKRELRSTKRITNANAIDQSGQLEHQAIEMDKGTHIV